MRPVSRLLSMLIAAGALAAAVAGANANTFSLVDKTFSVQWESLVFSAVGVEVECDVTLTGSFAEETLAKTRGAEVGTVSAATIGSCAGGTASVLEETLPWTITYQSFAGSLPEITSIRIGLVGAGMTIDPASTEACRTRSSAEAPIVSDVLLDAIGRVDGLDVDRAAEIPLDDTTGFVCDFAGDGTLDGTAAVTSISEEIPLIVMLGTEGTALANAEFDEEEAGASDITKLEIAGAEGTRAIRNAHNDYYDIELISIQLINENQEKFDIRSEEETACRAGRDMRPRAEFCNIRVRPKAEFMRPIDSAIAVTYRYTSWYFVTTTVTETFAVRAN